MAFIEANRILQLIDARKMRGLMETKEIRYSLMLMEVLEQEKMRQRRIISQVTTGNVRTKDWKHGNSSFCSLNSGKTKETCFLVIKKETFWKHGK